MKAGRESTGRRAVERVRMEGDALVRRRSKDVLVTEEPLEIRIAPAGGEPDRADRPLVVTMRTPGADFELVAGFLHAEGVVESADEILSMRHCRTGAAHGRRKFNVVRVELRTDSSVLTAGGRSFTATSSCGVCGKESLESVFSMPTRPFGSGDGSAEPAAGPIVTSETLVALPGMLRESQAVFERTGGLHAAARFTPDGRLTEIREDVGRHNALDKLIGAALLARELPLEGQLVLVSGRLGFELVQKSARAGVRVLAAVSAPSSLAVELAERAGMTLIGFLREDGFNVYTGAERVTLPGRAPAAFGTA